MMKPVQMDMPSKKNVERLYSELEKVLSGQPAVDIYNVLLNLLGYTLTRSATPSVMLMQTIQVLAMIVGVPVEKIDLDNEEEEQPDVRNIATH